MVHRIKMSKEATLKLLLVGAVSLVSGRHLRGTTGVRRLDHNGDGLHHWELGLIIVTCFFLFMGMMACTVMAGSSMRPRYYGTYFVRERPRVAAPFRFQEGSFRLFHLWFSKFGSKFGKQLWQQLSINSPFCVFR